jgi:serine/threonine protein kinase
LYFLLFSFIILIQCQLDQQFCPKLGDFGLSRMLADHQASATNLVGTSTHMAPEQFKSGAKHNPKKADVYSFGMLLFEMASNKVWIWILEFFI